MPQPTRIILVAGAHRGVGATVAQRLAGPSTHVIVADDISDETVATALIDDIARRFGRLDALILNVSDGREPITDPRYAMHVHRDAQRRLALLAMPLMPVGGRIVFATNHQAHFFPNKAVQKGFSAVAASQRAGETALYALRSTFSRAGIQLTVVSGNVTDSGDFAAAIVNSATTPSPSGIVFVGGASYQMTA